MFSNSKKNSGGISLFNNKVLRSAIGPKSKKETIIHKFYEASFGTDSKIMKFILLKNCIKSSPKNFVLDKENRTQKKVPPLFKTNKLCQLPSIQRSNSNLFLTFFNSPSSSRSRQKKMESVNIVSYKSRSLTTREDNKEKKTIVKLKSKNRNVIRLPRKHYASVI